MTPIRRALISVSDKTGVVEFARTLADAGVEILSTGGTASTLGEAGVPVREVSDYTGFPEMMDGRLKTLHPRVHGGLLARAGIDDDALSAAGIEPIDLLAVNLYPFARTVARPGCTLADAIEHIDIGGPAMLRAAAKNHARVTVVVRPEDYALVTAQMADNGGAVDDATRFSLAARAFEHTAGYDGAIANWLGRRVDGGDGQGFPRVLSLQFERRQDMRYGENPHQRAALFVEPDFDGISVARARQLQGKELSYNNIGDADAALACIQSFDPSVPCCVIVKHANPCGVATAPDPLEAYNRAYTTDPESAFGGIIAFNRALDPDTAKAIIERQFVEVIIAPAIDTAAAEVLATRPNVRVLACGQWSGAPDAQLEYKRISGGLLVQDSDLALTGNLEVVTRRAPDDAEMADLMFAWRVAKYVKSNAIVYGRGGMTVGVGAGQMSRVNSARIAVIKAEQAGLDVKGSVMASDAFFPFRDGIDSAAEAGVTAVIQPGGSMRDNEVIAAADEHGMAMVFTGMRHFRH